MKGVEFAGAAPGPGTPGMLRQTLVFLDRAFSDSHLVSDLLHRLSLLQPLFDRFEPGHLPGSGWAHSR